MKIQYEIDPSNWPLINRFSDDPTPSEAIQDIDGEEAVEIDTLEEDDKRVTEDVAELHRSLVASSGLEFERDYIDLGDQWARAVFVDQWPDTARNGFLQPLFADAGRQVDITTHISYRDQDDVQAELEHKLGDLESDVEKQNERRSAIRGKVSDTRDEVQAIYDAHVEGVPAVDTSMYLTVKGQTKEQVREDSQQLRKDLAKNPTNIKAVTARGPRNRPFKAARRSRRTTSGNRA